MATQSGTAPSPGTGGQKKKTGHSQRCSRHPANAIESYVSRKPNGIPAMPAGSAVLHDTPGVQPNARGVLPNARGVQEPDAQHGETSGPEEGDV